MLCKAASAPPRVCLRKHRLCRTFLISCPPDSFFSPSCASHYPEYACSASSGEISRSAERDEGLRTPRPARPFEKGRRKLLLFCALQPYSQKDRVQTRSFVCVNYLSPKSLPRTCIILSRSMGFARWPFIPERRARSRSSSKAFAVIAIIGMPASSRFSSVRISCVAA